MIKANVVSFLFLRGRKITARVCLYLYFGSDYRSGLRFSIWFNEDEVTFDFLRGLNLVYSKSVPWDVVRIYTEDSSSGDYSLPTFDGDLARLKHYWLNLTSGETVDDDLEDEV